LTTIGEGILKGIKEPTDVATFSSRNSMGKGISYSAKTILQEKYLVGATEYIPVTALRQPDKFTVYFRQ